MEIHRSARKPGVSDDDIPHAGTSYVIAYTVGDDGPPASCVVLMLDDGTELAIHAMKARPQYFDLLP